MYGTFNEIKNNISLPEPELNVPGQLQCCQPLIVVNSLVGNPNGSATRSQLIEGVG